MQYAGSLFILSSLLIMFFLSEEESIHHHHKTDTHKEKAANDQESAKKIDFHSQTDTQIRGAKEKEEEREREEDLSLVSSYTILWRIVAQTPMRHVILFFLTYPVNFFFYSFYFMLLGLLIRKVKPIINNTHRVTT